MVATRNKRKSSSGGGASSPAAATRSSKKGKAAASPETPDEIAEVAAASPTENDGGLDGDAGAVPQPPAAAETSIGESIIPDVDATDAVIQEEHDDEQQQRTDEATRADDASTDLDVAPKGSDESGDVKAVEEEVPPAETTRQCCARAPAPVHPPARTLRPACVIVIE